MKTTFKSSEIAHVWAHKQAPYGKSPGAMSFDGPCFYSYDTVIARHIEHRGQNAIVLNDYGFSVTTSRHEGKVRCAIPYGVPIFHASRGMGASLDVSGKELFEHAVEQSAHWVGKAEKAKGRKGQCESNAARWLEDAKAINAFFGLRRKVDEKTIERLRAASAEAEREAQRKAAEREAKQRAEQTEQYEAWKNGTASIYGLDARLFPVAFRIESRAGEGEHPYELVSTLGARVPLADAKRALAFVLRHRESNWTKNGTRMPVGMYQLDSVTDGGVVAGCHRISWEEIERLQAIL